jgi:hypothetical protein
VLTIAISWTTVQRIPLRASILNSFRGPKVYKEPRQPNSRGDKQNHDLPFHRGHTLVDLKVRETIALGGLRRGKGYFGEGLNQAQPLDGGTCVMQSHTLALYHFGGAKVKLQVPRLPEA